MHFLIFLSLFLFPYYPFSLHFLPTQTHVLFTILSTFTFANSSISERVNNGILLLLLFEVCIVLILKILLIPLCLHFVINVLRICLVVLCYGFFWEIDFAGCMFYAHTLSQFMCKQQKQLIICYILFSSLLLFRSCYYYCCCLCRFLLSFWYEYNNDDDDDVYTDWRIR